MISMRHDRCSGDDMTDDTSDNIIDDSELIAYCGLFCGECFAYRGRIAQLSKDLRKELREVRFDMVAKGIPFIMDLEPRTFHLPLPLFRIRAHVSLNPTVLFNTSRFSVVSGSTQK